MWPIPGAPLSPAAAGVSQPSGRPHQYMTEEERRGPFWARGHRGTQGLLPAVPSRGWVGSMHAHVTTDPSGKGKVVETIISNFVFLLPVCGERGKPNCLSAQGWGTAAHCHPRVPMWHVLR